MERGVVLVSGGRSIVPLEAAHVDSMWEAIVESGDSLRPTMPWWTPELSKEDMNRWAEFAESEWASGNLYAFSIFDQGTHSYLGAVSLESVNRERMTANLSYWTRSSATRQGVASSAARETARWGIFTLGLHRVEVAIVTSNVPSTRTARASGAAFEGTMRNAARWDQRSHDMAYFSFIPDDFR